MSQSSRRPDPVLVTGMPRSGTTWLARLLAQAPGSALAGREPMNPGAGQYRLGGTLSGWARIDTASARQHRALRRAYRAATPAVYSRYGIRQWAAPLPRTRLVVKDPFALLSVPAIVGATGARAVVIHRHPGAMLASYRRMGWQPDLGELVPVVDRFRRERGDGAPEIPELPHEADPGGALAMGWFWAALYAMALTDVDRAPGTLVVSHRRIATDPAACRRVHNALGVPWGPAADAEFSREHSDTGGRDRLHNFDRAPQEVADAWRTALAPEEVEEIEEVTREVRARMDRATQDGPADG
ncbi:sulfotransferase [Phycicoccus sp. BSK3Z-2]|uniref:Sulfotransferase n=1 Tax=Phycicoccus avicenniae TaxID=2828860 RepID=A0A941D8G3_9MICO|nr:sulfotransferase [Phycicoccus avicenniae]MBR7743695.1 sulfotransferase [Phycicoccus avicenniae]